jgi:hypothetical protein
MVALVTKPKKPLLLGFNVDEELNARVKARSSKFASGAEYLRSVVLADLDADAAKPRAFDSDVISNLAKIYGGYFAPTLTAQLAAQGIDQPKLLHAILRDLCELAAGGHPLTTTHVAPEECIAAAALPAAERAYAPAPPKRYIQRLSPWQDAAAAEDPPTPASASALRTAAQEEQARIDRLLEAEQQHKDRSPPAPIPVAAKKSSAKASG